jgi:hypothetical protein
MLKLWLHVEIIDENGESQGAEMEPLELAVLNREVDLDGFVDELLQACEALQFRERSRDAVERDRVVRSAGDEAS